MLVYANKSGGYLRPVFELKYLMSVNENYLKTE